MPTTTDGRARSHGDPGDLEFTDYVSARGQARERLAFVLVGDRDRAQDLLQTVLLKLYRRWSRVVAVEQPDAYVRRMIMHAFLDGRRSPAGNERPMAEVPDLPTNGSDPERRVVARESLAAGLNALSPHQRAVLVLRHLDGLGDEAIADLLGCSPTTVRTHASRGRDRFRVAVLGLTSEHVGETGESR